MKVIVGCEFSGVVREAFRQRGHDAWSCDLLPCDDGSEYHIQGDVREVLGDGWELAIFHPPCTYLTVSANRWMLPEYAHRFPNRPQQREEAVEFFMRLYNAPVKRIAVENPIGVMSSRFRKPDQVVQPWMFGHPEVKATCLWLKGLPKLQPTRIVPLPPERSKAMRLHYLPPSPERAKLRSVTFQGVAKAMSEQWGGKIVL